jgi:immune inhibitor A
MIDPSGPRPSNKPILIFLVILGFLLIACFTVGTYLVFSFASRGVTGVQTALPRLSPPTVEPSFATKTGLILSAIPDETLKTLQEAPSPIVDYLSLASRLEGKKNIPQTIPGPPQVHNIGDVQQFWVVKDITNVHFQVSATLKYITPHLYFWVNSEIPVDASRVQTASDTFENKIYPTDRALFGSEWTPGVDNDPHIYILYTTGPSSRVAAYFSSEDEINPAVDQFSNGHEMFVINSASFPNLSGDVGGVLAHEFQHMIEYNQHRNMEGWENEGFSVLATYLNGYGTDGYDRQFLPNPDTQLNDFPNNSNKIVPHYGASFLFLDYFYNRFGEQTTRDLAKNPADGLDGVDAALQQIDAMDNQTGQPITADDVFADWTVTNYLGDSTVGDGRYIYGNFTNVAHVSDTERVTRCPTSAQSRTVHQYAADYVRISCRGTYTLTFQGAQDVSVVPANPHSGSYYFWSSKGDESDKTLTHEFDFSSVNGAISLTYWTWYDTEKYYDYVYLEASTNGQDWAILKTPSGTTGNQRGSSYGIGYNGSSSGWIEQTIDLSQYAGQKVQLRFEYVTDDETYGEGFLLDDVSISQINYHTDFETDDGGWIADGFVRIENYLPQTYRLEMISLGSPATVQNLTLNPDQSLRIPLILSNDVVLVVSGTARYTRQLAPYTFTIQP